MGGGASYGRGQSDVGIGDALGRMFGLGSQTNYSRGNGIEPGILAGNTADARVNWASNLGKYDEIPDLQTGQWLWNMQGGPLSQNNPWGSGPLGTGWAQPNPNVWNPFGVPQQQIGPDTNLLGGTRHTPQKKNQ